MVDRIIKVVETPEELKVYQELIYKVYAIELQWLDPKNFPTGRVEDQYDPYSMHFLILQKGSGIIMSGIRIIRPSKVGIPLANDFEGVNLPNLELIHSHLGRTAVICDIQLSALAAFKDFRGQKGDFLLDSAKIVYQYMAQNGLGYINLPMDMYIFLAAHKLHLFVKPIGCPKYYMGSWVLPCIVFKLSLETELKQKNIVAYNYIVSPDNLVGSLRDINLQRR
ncbi:MAG: hypothetical protein NTZ49_03120 [Candidatus Parcubacteria bacterium]|nr:hypothetical protein [Candidatus Parcubacteria bacterium]